MKTVKMPTDVKLAIKQKYAWPGGYPLFLLTDDSDCLCIDCARDNLRQVVASTIGNYRDGWQLLAADVNWEDANLFCCNCGNPIESAYAE